MGKVSKFGKIFTIVFNIVFIALIICVSFLSLKFIFWSFLSIFHLVLLIALQYEPAN